MLKNMKIATWLMLMLVLLGLMPMGTGAIAFYFMVSAPSRTSSGFDWDD